ncbi:MAG: NfeD family protein, partial [Candidatus Omnitrophota bacterium]
GRNADWAEKAVRQSVSANEKDAVALKVADLSAENLTDLLAKIDNRVIRLGSKTIKLKIKSAPINEIKPNLRHRILQTVSDPNIAYILLLLGILGIIYEFSSPGLGFPGIVGFICILLAFYGLSALPVNIAGVALVFVGVGFFVLEAHSPSFGLLGLGGIVSLIFGSLFLIKPFSYLKIASRASSLTVAFVFAGLVFLVAGFAYRAMRRKVTTGKEGLIGEIGEARTDLAPEGTIYVHGEYWTARTSDGSTVKKGERVKVEKVPGPILLVKGVAKQ